MCQIWLNRAVFVKTSIRFRKHLQRIPLNVSLTNIVETNYAEVVVPVNCLPKINDVPCGSVCMYVRSLRSSRIDVPCACTVQFCPALSVSDWCQTVRTEVRVVSSLPGVRQSKKKKLPFLE